MFDVSPLEKTLRERGDNQCELCKSDSQLHAHLIPPHETELSRHHALLCDTCCDQIGGEAADLDTTHWFGLQDSIWSDVSAVQVLSWRMLHRLRSETWARDLLDQAYLAPEDLQWAKEGLQNDDDGGVRTLDSNGTELEEGDSVTLIKDLDVKGAGFTAKRGTMVKNIHLTDDPGHVDARVNGIAIVLKTEFLKKA